MYERYCKLRNLNGYKDSDISRITGITKSTFTDWKNGKSKPNAEKLLLISKCLNTTIEYLMTGEDNRTESPVFDEDHIELITLYSKLNKEQKEAVFNLLRSFAL